MISMYKSFMTRIADLIRRVEALERFNRARIMKFGKITLDADAGTITVDDDNDNEIIDIGEDGIDIIKPGSLNGYETYLRYKDDNDNIGRVTIGRFTSGPTEITDVQSRVLMSDEDETITYNTIRIDDETGLRQVFLQIDYSDNTGVFQSSALTFGLHGQDASFIVFCDASDGTGYARIPRRASDPSIAGDGYMYFNTTTKKFRGFDGSNWHDFH